VPSSSGAEERTAASRPGHASIARRTVSRHAVWAALSGSRCASLLRPSHSRGPSGVPSFGSAAAHSLDAVTAAVHSAKKSTVMAYPPGT